MLELLRVSKFIYYDDHCIALESVLCFSEQSRFPSLSILYSPFFPFFPQVSKREELCAMFCSYVNFKENILARSDE